MEPALLTGAIALIALAAMLVLRLWGTNRIANFGAQVAALMFIAWALFAATMPWASDVTFSPFPQYGAHNQVLFLGLPWWPQQS